ncbi:MAG: glycoside hydrolase [Candidatus Omnitrophica bacterium]|nr:glycoside hydrolase [Candidatus Omnitrophota bacterium]
MKFVAQRPVTIHSVRNDTRWFPFVFRHTDGSLLLYIECGYDAHFSPFFRLRSTDNGKTWIQDPVVNVPRVSTAHSFKNGELFEIDTYGVLSSKEKDTYLFYGAWSHPGKPNDVVKKDFIKVYAPSFRPVCLETYQKHPSYPTYPWWDLFNLATGKKEAQSSDVFLGGAYFTSIIEPQDNILLALGYWYLKKDPENWKYAVGCFESNDRGKTWFEKSIVAYDPNLPEGYDEATLVQLKDGRLYTVMRTGGYLYHAWSQDSGKTWQKPEQLKLIDSDIMPGKVWPVCRKLEDGALVLVYGRPGKHIIFDPSGTGTEWQGHFDLHNWELETQKFMGVPENLRLRGDTGNKCIRYWDSGDYLALAIIGAREMLVFYDVQNFVENWNSYPVSGVRMVKLSLD